ncbi:hypothetical protein [Bacillus sp. MRMR6]|uniref:hypothetical protein n=1 Tax=Bacillus sp. MRMR6 TaxID=1928617 RepID=UPI000951470F|nr:hypothetical protein [Bacillus sp. MRMR6]OLS39155.1 hypothetical protein BTR25_13575 [Bacillus sp. MRMR6]
MSILIEVHYISSESKIMRRGSFPLRGKSKEQVALSWWKEIKREMPYGAELEILKIDGEDVTEVIKEMV